MVADIFSAKRGFPNMGIAACFGGPLFSKKEYNFYYIIITIFSVFRNFFFLLIIDILLGIGISFTIRIIQSGHGYTIQTSLLQDILALFLGISLVSSLIFIPLNKFHFSRKYGIYLIALYVIFLTVCILVESGIIHE